MTTIRELILAARRQLEQHQIEDAAFNADWLAAMALHTVAGRLPMLWQHPADAGLVENLTALVQRRCAHEPLQYILGEWSFLDFDVNVAPGALIPRPETEEVFLAAARAIESSSFRDSFRFADIGTGTGILGIALARRFSGASGFLADISPVALAVATSNLARFPEIADRVVPIRSDLLSFAGDCQLQVVLSNPPYISSTEIEGLMPEVKSFEPHLALDGGVVGIELIERLIRQAETVLTPGGLLIFEHGHGQRRQLMTLLNDKWQLIEASDDLGGCERYFVLKRSDNR